MTKELLLKTAEQMPDSFHMDDLFERLVFLEKLQQGMDSLDNGKGIPHEEFQKRMNDFMEKRRNERNNMVA